MHNCGETKEQITEFVLDGADRRPDEILLAELRACAECRAEFNALNATLRVTTRLRDTAPAESYWIGYHDRLRQRIELSAGKSRAEAHRRKGESRSFFTALRLCVRTTVPVPVPLIIAVVLAAFALFAVLAARKPAAQTPVIVHVPVEVPVVQEKEKLVTRVVYRDRRWPARTSKRLVDASKIESIFAKSRKLQDPEIPGALMGFKPTEEVKLTIIKGGSQNEK